MGVTSNKPNIDKMDTLFALILDKVKAVFAV